MQAYNYMAGVPDLNVQFAGLGEALAERNKIIRADETKAQLSKDLAEAQRAGDANSYFNLMVKYPQLKDVFNEKRKEIGAEAVKNEFSQGAQIATALENNRPEIATDLLNTKIEAAKNAGKPTGTYQQILDQINEGRYDVAKSATNQLLMLTSPEQFKQYNETLLANAAEKRAAELQPLQVKRATAEAQTAETGAKFAEAKATSDLATADMQRQAIQNDMALNKQRLALEAQRVRLQAEDNGLKRQQMQLDYDAKSFKFQEKVNEKVQGALKTVETIDSGMDTIETLKDHIKKNPNALARTFGPVASRLPTITQGSADLEALVETIKSKTFLSSVSQMKGLGALSDKEGAKLTSSIANLDKTQSPESFQRNINYIYDTYKKGRAAIEKDNGIPPRQTQPTTATTSKAPSGQKTISVNY